MAVLLAVFEGDVDTWKSTFDSDPLGRKQVAKGHKIFRSVDPPDQMFVRVEFDSADDARAFAEKVRGSGVLASVTVKVPPTVAELVDEATY